MTQLTVIQMQNNVNTENDAWGKRLCDTLRPKRSPLVSFFDVT